MGADLRFDPGLPWRGVAVLFVAIALFVSYLDDLYENRHDYCIWRMP
jgi:hypothetical protein